MYEAMFDMQFSLCEVFTGMNPIMVRKYPAHEVFLLMKRLTKKSEREKKKYKKPGVIRKKAGDDWF